MLRNRLSYGGTPIELFYLCNYAVRHYGRKVRHFDFKKLYKSEMKAFQISDSFYLEIVLRPSIETVFRSFARPFDVEVNVLAGKGHCNFSTLKRIFVRFKMYPASEARPNNPSQLWGSCCSSVGRVVASDTRGPWFESSHRQKFY